MSNRRSWGALIAVSGGLVIAPAQRALQFDVVYSCSNGQTKLKVLGCAGNSDADACDIQYLDPRGQQGLGARISAPRKQVTELLQTCVIQRPPAKVENTAPPAAQAPRQERPPAQNQSQPRQPSAAQSRPASPPPPPQQVGAGGLKVGDSVSVLTGFGWVDGKVLSVNGPRYYVRVGNGVDVWKDYPAEVRRVGAPTPEDHANGVYQLHDRVQVLFEGKWIDSEIITTLGMEYQVKLPGNRVAWVNPQQLRYVGPQVKPPSKVGIPPKPGLTSCAGKIEGRYSSGGFGNFTIVFKGSKANVAMYGDGEDAECWIGGGKIYLRTPHPDLPEMVLEINNDGTLDSPAGELKKKGN